MAAGQWTQVEALKELSNISIKYYYYYYYYLGLAVKRLILETPFPWDTCILHVHRKIRQSSQEFTMGKWSFWRDLKKG